MKNYLTTTALKKYVTASALLTAKAIAWTLGWIAFVVGAELLLVSGFFSSVWHLLVF